MIERAPEKTIKLLEIKPYAANAKKHSPEQIKVLIQSIDKYKLIQDICVDKDNFIVVGHGRYYGLLEKYSGNEDIVVKDLSYLKPKEIKKLRILDNKIVSQDYDNDLLQAEIESLYNNIQDDIDKISDELNINYNDFKKTEKELELGDNIPEYLTFLVNDKERKFIEKKLKKCNGENNTEKLLWMFQNFNIEK